MCAIKTLIMGSERRRQAGLWNREYSQSGALWRGPAHFDFSIRNGSKVLELGCGNGKTLSALPRECEVTAIDPSKKAVELCRALAEAEGIEAQIIEADVCELPFKDASFDAVVAFHVLEHLIAEDREKAVEEIHRVLAPGGSLLVKVFSTRDMRCGKGKEIEQGTFLRGKGIYYHYFTCDGLRSLLNGFREKSLSVERRLVRYHGEELEREKLAGEYVKA